MPTRRPLMYRFAATVTLDPASVPANEIPAAQTFTVEGLLPDMVVFVSGPSLEDEVFIADAWVSDTDTLNVRFGNVSGSPINPASQSFDIVAI